MIRKAVINDFADFYNIKSESENMYWCGFVNKPNKENLWKFWNRYVPTNMERTIYSIIVDEEWGGTSMQIMELKMRSKLA